MVKIVELTDEEKSIARKIRGILLNIPQAKRCRTFFRDGHSVETSVNSFSEQGLCHGGELLPWDMLDYVEVFFDFGDEPSIILFDPIDILRLANVSA